MVYLCTGISEDLFIVGRIGNNFGGCTVLQVYRYTDLPLAMNGRLVYQSGAILVTLNLYCFTVVPVDRFARNKGGNWTVGKLQQHDRYATYLYMYYTTKGN